MKEVTVIIVSYNVRELLKRCLESIIKSDKLKHFKIIVVDNNSKDNSAGMIHDCFSNVILVKNRKNLGFSAANNIALKKVDTKYVTLLNPDTIVQNGALDNLVKFMETHNKTGAVGPRIKNPDGSQQKSCRRLPNILDALYYISGILRIFPKTKHFRLWLQPNFDYNQAQKVEYISGACILFKKEVFDDIGLLDERFFLYSEDTDLCFRMKKQRWPIYYCPNAEIIHYGGQSSEHVEEWRQAEEMFKSWLKYRKKHYNRIHSISFNILTDIILITKIAYLHFAKRPNRIEKIQMYNRLLFWYFKHLL